MPALWIVADLGESSKLVAAGLLMMGGITGFYLMLGFRKLRFETLKDKLQMQTQEKHITEENISERQDTVIVKGAESAVVDMNNCTNWKRNKNNHMKTPQTDIANDSTAVCARRVH